MRLQLYIEYSTSNFQRQIRRKLSHRKFLLSSYRLNVMSNSTLKIRCQAQGIKHYIEYITSNWISCTISKIKNNYVWLSLTVAHKWLNVLMSIRCNVLATFNELNDIRPNLSVRTFKISHTVVLKSLNVLMSICEPNSH